MLKCAHDVLDDDDGTSDNIPSQERQREKIRGNFLRSRQIEQKERDGLVTQR